MIIGVTAFKGGAGKTTLCVNLAVYYAQLGFKVAIIDADGQQSLYDWYKERVELYDDIPSVHVETNPDFGSIGFMMNDLYKNKGYDYVLVDGVPQINNMSSAILRHSHMVVTPVSVTGMMDVRSTGKFLEYYKKSIEEWDVFIPLFVAINKYKATNTRKEFTNQVLKQAEEFNVGVFDAYLSDLKVHEEAFGIGKAVCEYGSLSRKLNKQEDKALLEINTIIEEIMSVQEALNS